MIFTTALTVCLLPVFAAAQYGYGGDASSSSTQTAPSTTASASASAPSAPADTQGHLNVDVFFNKTFTFHPANITAPNGTLVTFWFPNSAASHSVTQSSFANPCTYLAANGSTPAGFDSGLQTAVHFSINITNDNKPIWFYCKQATHCGMGMVGSINAATTGNNTFKAFQAAALKIGSSEAKETDNGPVTGGVNGIATAPPTSATATTSAPSSTSTRKSGGAINVAISTGAVLFAAVLVVTFV